MPIKSNITINDIAKELGLTPSTVSRALTNSPRVKEKTKHAVLAVANRLGYQPNVMASSLRKGTSGSIGMIVPRINRHFFSNAISGVERYVNPAGYNLLISQTEEIYQKEVSAIENMLKNRVAGIIISLSAGTKKYSHIEEIVKRNVPLVQFDRVNEQIKSHIIVNDNFNGSYLGTKHLIKQGYKRIAHLGGAFTLSQYNERMKGYLGALQESDMPIDKNLIFENCITREAGINIVSQLIDLKVDAVHCAGDYAALGVLLELKSKGISIPSDIGVIGCANEPFSEIITPSVSTLELNAFEIGNKAAHGIISMIENEGNCYFGKEVVPVRLIIRESSNRLMNNVLSFS